MRAQAIACALALCGCGIESIFDNLGHDQYERPASKISGAAPNVTDIAQISVIDGDGKKLVPFQATLNGTNYELRLPSSKYSMIRVVADVGAGEMELRAIVPSIAEESAVSGVDLDARNMAETLITEARLSSDGSSLKQVTPSAYEGTRTLIRQGLDAPGPTQDLASMVQRFIDAYDPTVNVMTPYFFLVPAYCRNVVDPTCGGTPIDADYVLRSSAIDKNFLARSSVDYVGDGHPRNNSDDFDRALAKAAELYRPAGCPDPSRIRVVFTVDFNSGTKNGNCGSVNRFTWATDKPGKSMFFVGWTYTTAPLKPSDITDPAVDTALGSSTPNTVPMYDDGTNGDEKAGDNIWTVYFDVPKGDPPGQVLRIGYKYTWGTAGAPWTGSEEWPGNARILEVVDDNGDGVVYRHDVFGDEATNKDKANLNIRGAGSIDWPTDLHGCGTPESHENKYDDNSCKCGSVLTPKGIGALTVTCTQ